MKLNFKKISAIATSALMIGMSAGVAAAASYPAPFIQNGVADVAVVVGANAPLDTDAATSLQTSLSSQVTATGPVTVSGEDVWKVGETNDPLELGESIKDITSYIGSSELPILSDGSLTNEKGTAKYKQYLYFEDTSTSSVTYQEDDEDNVGLFFKVGSGNVIARYVMDFTTALESDIDSDGTLSDIKDEEISVMGKTYTITRANNGTGGVELTLMSGTAKATLSNEEEQVVGGKTVKPTIIDSTHVRFNIDGYTTPKMNEGDIEPIGDSGEYIAVASIDYSTKDTGVEEVTFFIGADKMELNNGSSLVVNSDSITDAEVTIDSTESNGDISIREISVNMTAEDDLYVPEGGRLSEAENLRKPEVLFTQGWDIVFSGLEDRNYETVSLKPSEGDSQYKLSFENEEGNQIDLPLVYSNTSGVFAGDTSDKKLVLNASAGITKKDYFVLNTADPSAPSNDAITYVLQYTNADKQTSTDSPKLYFKVLGGDDTEATYSSSAGTFSLKLGSQTFTFSNTSAMSSNDFNIKLDSPLNGVSSSSDALTISMRTKYNGLLQVTNMNSSLDSSSWKVNLTIDDTERDDDDVTLPENVFVVTLSNASDGDFSSSLGGDSGSWISDPDNSDLSTYVTRYGAKIESVDTSSSPVSLTAEVPESIVEPIVQITSTSAIPSEAELGVMIVTDAKVSSVSDKNLIIVGGSCINTAAAAALGVPEGTCGADFTAATGVGVGQFLLKSVSDSSLTSKIALVAAGYEMADTKAAVDYLMTQDIDTESVGQIFETNPSAETTPVA